ncbi:MAG TPA: NnrU family protein [Candidatus Binatia bacterium]|nr:NnrU family protein [Candidatus Binatia bacterium]
MEPTLTIVGLWLVFGGTHVGLATRGVRDRFVASLGELGFRALYTLVASATFAALVMFYAAHRFEGAPGLALGRYAPLRVLLMGVVGLGVVLQIMGLIGYPRSPTSVARPRVQPALGVARITRHAFFVGIALLAGAHALLATRLVGTVFFSALAALAVIGSWHQDQKLIALRGRAYADYVASTSAIPFVAIAAGRQPFAWRELSFTGVALGIAAAIGLRRIHDSILAGDGVWFVAAVVAGAAIAGLASLWGARRTRARAAIRPASLDAHAP